MWENIRVIEDMTSIAGTTHVLIVDHENTVWAAGNNQNLQLGRDDKTTCLKAVQGLPPIKLAAAGWEHSLFLDFEGNMWACGSNKRGEWGMPFSEQEEAAGILKIATTFVAKSIACGCNHSYILDVDGCVWSCGNNGYGQLGSGEKSKRNYYSFCKVVSLPPIKSVYALGNFGYFLDNEGCAWAVGLNSHGQLGTGDHKSIESPCKITNLPPIQTIACGGNHTLLLDYSGVVWTCGVNFHSKPGHQVVVPDKIENVPEVVAISCGWYHCMMLDVDGCVWVFGKNDQSQLGLESKVQQIQPMKLTNLPKIQQIYCGWYHSMFVDYECNVWVCGEIKKDLGLGVGYEPEQIPSLTVLGFTNGKQTKSARFT